MGKYVTITFNTRRIRLWLYAMAAACIYSKWPLRRTRNRLLTGLADRLGGIPEVKIPHLFRRVQANVKMIQAIENDEHRDVPRQPTRDRRSGILP